MKTKTTKPIYEMINIIKSVPSTTILQIEDFTDDIPSYLPVTSVERFASYTTYLKYNSKDTTKWCIVEDLIMKIGNISVLKIEIDGKIRNVNDCYYNDQGILTFYC